ncbi:MAG: hypothetical protein KQ78_01791 [Candidatus Izimaplasma bacterium HR2]|nr:MAG: hypothetical protein KQ78_01791 [Candidatus Izimaplasma bacterium HR2]
MLKKSSIKLTVILSVIFLVYLIAATESLLAGISIFGFFALLIISIVHDMRKIYK